MAPRSHVGSIPSPGTAPATGGRTFLIGCLCAISAVTIWAGWIVLTRLSVSRILGVYDITALRFSVAGLLLLPVVLRRSGTLRRIGWGGGLIMATGSGAPYMLLASAGVALAPAAHAGPLLPGIMPLFAALLSWLVLKEKLLPARILGLGLILLGVLSVGGQHLLHSLGDAWMGHLLLMSAAFLWASYTVALRRLGVAALDATAVVSVLSAALYLPVYILVLPHRLGDAAWEEILFQGLFQGVGSGIVALVAYNRAVALIGPSRAASFGALVPVTAMLTAIPLLDEWPSGLDVAGVVAVSIGVLLASGGLAALRRR